MQRRLVLILLVFSILFIPPNPLAAFPTSVPHPSADQQIPFQVTTGTLPGGLGWLNETVPSGARKIYPKPQSGLSWFSHWDWRDEQGYNWMTPVEDQRQCKSCTAFAAVGATETQFKIAQNDPSWNLDLSEQHLFSCGGASCSVGWTINESLSRLKGYGTPDAACYPNPTDGQNHPCSGGCTDWQSRAYKLSDWGWVYNDPQDIEAALQNGPLVAGFAVYSDFYWYFLSHYGGIYHWDHVSQFAGYHAVVIVGYDESQQYWIVKNSWGNTWGENGYFRIGWGEAGIEQHVAWIKAGSRPSVVTTQRQYQVQVSVYSLQSGQSISSQNDLRASIAVSYVSGGTGSRITQVTPFTLYVDPFSFVTFSVSSALGGYAFANKWTDLGLTYSFATITYNALAIVSHTTAAVFTRPQLSLSSANWNYGDLVSWSASGLTPNTAVGVVIQGSWGTLRFTDTTADASGNGRSQFAVGTNIQSPGEFELVDKTTNLVLATAHYTITSTSTTQSSRLFYGWVFRNNAQALAGATVTATSTSGQTPLTTGTGSDGAFSMMLPYGSYTITFSAPGYQSQSIQLNWDASSVFTGGGVTLQPMIATTSTTTSSSVPSYVITVNTSPSELNVPITGGGTYPLGWNFGISVGFVTGYTFVKWLKDGIDFTNQQTFLYVVDGSHTFTAVFQPISTVTSATATLGDFSIAVSPSSFNVAQGQSVVATVTITSMAGFNSPVTLSMASLGSMGTASFQPNPVTPAPGGSVSSLVSINFASSVANSYIDTGIAGTSGTLSHEARLTIIVGTTSSTTSGRTSTSQTTTGVSTFACNTGPPLAVAVTIGKPTYRIGDTVTIQMTANRPIEGTLTVFPPPGEAPFVIWGISAFVDYRPPYVFPLTADRVGRWMVNLQADDFCSVFSSVVAYFDVAQNTTQTTSSATATTTVTSFATVTVGATVHGQLMQVVSNSTVSDLIFDSVKGLLNFTVSGSAGTSGFLNVKMAKSLVSGSPVLLVDGVQQQAVVSGDSDFWYIYATYHHSLRHITIGGSGTIPEFKETSQFLLVVMMTSLAMMSLRKRTRPRI